MDTRFKQAPNTSTNEYVDASHNSSQYDVISMQPLDYDNRPIYPQNDPHAPLRTARWGVHWMQEPLQLPGFTLLGLLLAVGHHVLYSQLDGDVVDNQSVLSQQAVKQAGNAFAFLTVAACRSAMQEAYHQYIWMLFRKKAFRVGVIDKLFSLFNILLSFFSRQALSQAKVAILLGLFSWLLFLGGLTPAATLDIVPSIRPRVTTGELPVLNFNATPWFQTNSLQTEDSVAPTALVLKMAMRTALDMNVIPPRAPALNATFSVQFHGPTLQCNDSSDAQALSLDFFSRHYANQSTIFTAPLLRENKTEDFRLITKNYLVYSAFSPTTSVLNPSYRRDDFLAADVYRNWDVSKTTLLLNHSALYRDENNNSLPPPYPQQIWIQLSNSNMICSLVNASFDVTFLYTNGVGKIASQNINILPANGTANSTAVSIDPNMDFLARSNLNWNFKTPYFTTFLAYGSTLFGNASIADVANNDTYHDVYMAEASSPILQTGLVACDEIAHNYWYKEMGLDDKGTKFPSEPWMCRNGSLARGIEDMANNITISMLSSMDLTGNVTGTMWLEEAVNVYDYNPKYLLASYGAVLFVTLISVAIGTLALFKNGVYHSTTFSTVMATTRNKDLDDMTEGACLGGKEGIRDVSLMYGVLKNHEGREKGGLRSRHAAFGLQGTVERLRKGEAVS